MGRLRLWSVGLSMVGVAVSSNWIIINPSAAFPMECHPTYGSIFANKWVNKCGHDRSLLLSSFSFSFWRFGWCLIHFGTSDVHGLCGLSYAAPGMIKPTSAVPRTLKQLVDQVLGGVQVCLRELRDDLQQERDVQPNFVPSHVDSMCDVAPTDCIAGVELGLDVLQVWVPLCGGCQCPKGCDQSVDLAISSVSFGQSVSACHVVDEEDLEAREDVVEVSGSDHYCQYLQHVYVGLATGQPVEV